MNNFDKKISDEVKSYLDENIEFSAEESKKIQLKIQKGYHKSRKFNPLYWTVLASAATIFLILTLSFLKGPIANQDNEHVIQGFGNENFTLPEGEELAIPENDKNQSNSKDVVEVNETSMEIHTGSTETVIRNNEGQDQEIKVINYHIPTYGIAYQLDEVFGVPEVINNQINYSSQYAGYKITLEMIEHTNLEKSVSNLQERFETEGFKEKFELESTPLEENELTGKMQFYGYPVKGFIAYEIDEHVLVITFQYSEEGADSMNPLLEDLRKSIHVQ